MSDSSSNGFDSFCKVIRETLTLFDDLNSFEDKKLDALTENDVTLLDQFINDEQAYLMKMRGLDQKREKLQQDLGTPDLTFREMIEKFKGEERETLRGLYEELTAKSTRLKDAITSTKRQLELHLASISALIEKIEGSEGTYDRKGDKGAKAPPERFVPTKA